MCSLLDAVLNAKFAWDYNEYLLYNVVTILQTVIIMNIHCTYQRLFYFHQRMYYIFA